MQRNSLGTILKQSFVPLIQGRAIISCASILSEYWITYLSLKKQGSSSTYSLPPNVKRLLMAKEMLLSWSWSGLILKEFFRNYHQKTVEWIKYNQISNSLLIVHPSSNLKGFHSNKSNFIFIFQFHFYLYLANLFIPRSKDNS